MGGARGSGERTGEKGGVKGGVGLKEGTGTLTYILMTDYCQGMKRKWHQKSNYEATGNG